MPPLIAGVIVAAAYIVGGATGILGISMTAAYVMAALSIASGAASYALQSKAKAPAFNSLNQQRMITARDSIRARELVYGRVRKGGVVFWLGSFAYNNWFTLAIALAGHQCEAIEGVYYGDELIFDHTGTALGRFQDDPGGGQKTVLLTHLGAVDQSADGFLSTFFPDYWNHEFKARGVTYIVVGMAYNPTLFRGIPNITAIVQGRRVYDPRSQTTVYSANPALCVADYLCDVPYGLGADYATEIDEDALIAAANICDEMVDTPNGLEKRYTCNGILSSGTDPQQNLEMLLSSMAGRAVYTNGTWVIHAGAYVAPTIPTFTEADLRGPLQIQTRIQRRDLCNAVRGVFVSPERYWQVTDFPPVTSEVFKAQDDDKRLWRDVELPMTTSVTMAQRLARIELYATREQLSFTGQFSLAALQVRAWDVIAITNARMGWNAKPFLVTDWTFGVTTDRNGAPIIGCQLSGRETSAAVYAVTPDDQALLDAAPNTMLPRPFDVEPPGVPDLTENLYITRAGAGVKTSATITWAPSPTASVREYQVEWQYLGPDTPDPDFVLAAPSTPDTTVTILDVAPGTYAIRVKAITDLGAISEYATRPMVQVVGVAAPPAAITGLTISTLGGIAILRWNPITDVDVLVGGTVVFRHDSDTATPTWETSVSIGEAVPGSTMVALLPLKPGTYLVKARDSSGILSRTAATVTTDGATVLAYAAVGSVSEHPTYAGTHTGTVVSSGDLKLDSADPMDDWTDVDAVVNWDAEGGLLTAGTYDFSGGFDFTTKSRRRLRTVLTVVIDNELDQVDARGALVDAWQDWDGTGVADADCQIWYRTTDDDPAGTPTWSAWQRLDSGEVYCRGVDLQARLSSVDPSYNILVSECTVSADYLA